MIDDDLRRAFDALTATVSAPADPYTPIQRRAARLRRRRVTTSLAALVVVAGVALPLLLQAGRATRAADESADGVVTRSCDRTSFAFAARLGPVQAVYGVRLTARAASHWIDPTTYRPDPTLVALPATDQVSFCLVVGDLDSLTQPDPAPSPSTSPAGVSDAHVALVTVIDGRASARYIGGSDYSLLPAEPGPGIRKSDVAPFVVLNGSTVASAAPSQVAAVPRCRSADLSSRFSYDAEVDGSPQWSVTVRNVATATCSIFGVLTVTPLDRTGASLPLPNDAVLGRVRVSGVLPPQGAKALRVTVYGDASTNLCTRAQVQVPTRLRLSVGDATMSVVNHATTAVAGRTAVSGCPGRIYAGSADIG
jgi:hypothetical protein